MSSINLFMFNCLISMFETCKSKKKFNKVRTKVENKAKRIRDVCSFQILPSECIKRISTGQLTNFAAFHSNVTAFINN